MGWPVPELQAEIPVGMRVTEDSDSVLIDCLWCGEGLRYAKSGPAAEKLISDARRHRARCKYRPGPFRTGRRRDD